MMDNQTNKSSTPKESGTSTLDLEWYWTLRWIIGVLIITGNAIIIVIVIIRRRLRNAIPNQFIVSLAVADFFMGAVIIPAAYYCSNHTVCDWTILYTVFNLLLFCSICNLCVMTLDRFLAVVFPYTYQTFMTQRKAWLLMAVAWAIPTTISVIPFAWKYKEPSVKASYQKIFAILQTLLIEITPCVLMIVTHIPIYLIVRKHSRQIACQNAPQASNNQSRSKAKNERSTVKVFTVVVFLFILCYCFSIYREVCKHLELCSPPFEITLVSRLLYLSNSAMNPFVYSFLKRDIRREMKRTLKTCLRCFGVDVDVRSDDSESSMRSRQPEPREMCQ